MSDMEPPPRPVAPATPPSPPDLMVTAAGFMRARVLLSAVELGLVEALAGHELTAAEAAARRIGAGWLDSRIAALRLRTSS